MIYSRIDGQFSILAENVHGLTKKTNTATKFVNWQAAINNFYMLKTD